MAGLLAWAADVVGANHSADVDGNIPTIFTQEQQNYVQELDGKAASLSRAIRDLRLRLPPPDISQRLPHLHAHSLASNAALALQLNAHSSTKEQAQLREVTLQEENAAYEKALSDCQHKVQEKMREAELLQSKLQEMDEEERKLREELENAEASLKSSQSGKSLIASETTNQAESESEVEEKLEKKKKELSSIEQVVQGLEKRWAKVQENALKQPTPAQREKILDKQFHSLIEQLAAKQTQAEGLVSEIHLKEMEVERLNGVWRRLESSSNMDANTARNRGKSWLKGSSSSEYIVDKLPLSSGARTAQQERLMLLRSAFVLYILLLNIVVFIKLSF